MRDDGRRKSLRKFREGLAPGAQRAISMRGSLAGSRFSSMVSMSSMDGLNRSKSMSNFALNEESGGDAGDIFKDDFAVDDIDTDGVNLVHLLSTRFILTSSMHPESCHDPRSCPDMTHDFMTASRYSIGLDNHSDEHDDTEVSKYFRRNSSTGLKDAHRPSVRDEHPSNSKDGKDR